MAKFLYYLILGATALLLYNWFFVPGKIMSNGQNEKSGFGTITIIACLICIGIGYLFYTGNVRWANIAVYSIFGIGLIWLVYLITHVRWN